MSEKEKQVPCIRCGQIPEEKDKFCTLCGTPVKNTCCDEPGKLDKGCKHVNPQTAAYCAKCGLPTIYKLYGIVN
ncbi:hypothetical protein ACE3NQ_22780 [Paenibacillus terreus]|uniref:DZANK-type domain-containing protein n=1 Tax=Paenibacillus terreus TaxID=1387834 RepID=A0ABV5BGW1_9BACL